MLGLELKRVGAVRDTGDGRCLLEILPAYREGLDGLAPGAAIRGVLPGTARR